MDYKIKAPIWKNRTVGIAEHLLESHNTIEILYKNKEGKQIYPQIFGITKRQALRYPVQIIRGTRLRIIPINGLQVVRQKDWL